MGLHKTDNDTLGRSKVNSGGGGLSVASAGGGASFPTPIFQVDFSDGDITPEIGTAGTFSRASALNYYDTNTTLGAVTSGNPAVEAFGFNSGATDGGFYLNNTTANLLQYSEAPATAPWGTVGAPTSVNNSVGTFVGTIAYGTIVAAAGGDGITQDSGIALGTTTKGYSFSFYGSVASGTQAVTLTLAGTGATPQTATKGVTLTTTPQRFYIFKKFTSAATGTATVSLTVDAAATVRVGGIQLEATNSTAYATYYTGRETPSVYVKTTSAVAAVPVDNLKYTGAEVAKEHTVWSQCAWLYIDYAVSIDIFTVQTNKSLWGPYLNGLATLLFSIAGDGKFRPLWYTDSAEAKLLQGSGGYYTPGWYHLCLTADTVAGQFKMYIDGAEDTPYYGDTTAGTAAFTWQGVVFNGGTIRSGQGRGFGGGISRFKMYDVALTAVQVATLYAAESGYY